MPTDKNFGRINVLIVDDSIVFREYMLRELEKDKDIGAVLTAADAYEAVDNINKYDLDVLIIDVNMPKMNGVEFMKRIMSQYPIPIIGVSSNEDFARDTTNAGAVDFIEKPGFGPGRDIDTFFKTVLDRVKKASKLSANKKGYDRRHEQDKQVKQTGQVGQAGFAGQTGQAGQAGQTGQTGKAGQVGQAGQTGQRPDNFQTKDRQGGGIYRNERGYAENNSGARTYGRSHIKGGISPWRKHTDKVIIAIGASAGGTEAIAELVSALPSGLPGIVIVQHMPPDFTAMFAERLNSICRFETREAKNGDIVMPDTALVAPGNFQLRVVKTSISFSVNVASGEKVSGHCPSVDVMFSSVAACAGQRAIGVILTGMGRDGANGLLEMRRRGAKTVGQDEQTCVVYGMPKVAYDLGAVIYQLPLKQIAGKILDLL